MKARLLYRDRDLNAPIESPTGLPTQRSGLDHNHSGRESPTASNLARDLSFEVLFDAMGAGDAYLREVAARVVPEGLAAPEAIRYRQAILSDCLAFPDVVRQIYAVATSAIDNERQVWGWTFRQPEALLHRSVQVLGIFRDHLGQLRGMADVHRSAFRSEGFTTLFAMLARELDDAYLGVLAEHLRQLRFRDGMLISARLGEVNQSTDLHVRRPLGSSSGLRKRMADWVHQFLGDKPTSYAYQLADRDEAGFQALQALRDRALASVASALEASMVHILDFFKMLRTELAFYLGCLNLHERLADKGSPLCFPEPAEGDFFLQACGLYDASLSLSMAERVIGNDVGADQARLVMITGANRGGKTTFLRSVGLAQVLMQCGMFVPAEEYRAGVCEGVFTHFKREEDPALCQGKLDEELSRMSMLVDQLKSGSLLLLNESFASTNEREGSEISRQIVRALTEKGVKIIYVTHLFDLADSLRRSPPCPTLFLRAERLPDGRRTFKLLEGAPLSTSYGSDVYAQVFGRSALRVSPAQPGPVAGNSSSAQRQSKDHEEQRADQSQVEIQVP